MALVTTLTIVAGVSTIAAMLEIAERIDTASAAINHPIGAVAGALTAVTHAIRAGVAAGPAMIAVIVQVDAGPGAIGRARRAASSIVVALAENTALVDATGYPASAAVIVTRLSIDTSLTALYQARVAVADTVAQTA